MTWASCMLVTALLLLAPSALAQGVGGFVSPGDLSRDHADLDGPLQCLECHAPARGTTPDRCMACHKEIRADIRDERGYHKDKGDSCADCHPEHRGRDFEISIVPDPFPHEQTGFDLEGEHRRIECEDCHRTETFRGLDATCSACHADPHGAVSSDRDVLEDCSACHDAEDWDALPLPVSVFDHEDDTQVDYVLELAHIQVECSECHTELRFVPVAFEQCIDCHPDPHRFRYSASESCEDCHPVPDDWNVETFDHERTSFSLRGLHRLVECFDCHGPYPTEPLPHKRCESCHEDVHRGQFAPRNCTNCHGQDTEGFKIPDFDHATTRWPLTGEHAFVECSVCHEGGVNAQYANTNFDDCDACHEDTHEGKFEPVRCEVCHTTEGFAIAEFDHDRTSFPHTGAHIDQPCEGCHIDGSWTGIAFDWCQDCHHEENPHRDVITEESCEDCHVTATFSAMVFDHGGTTEFSLEPQHVETKCIDCHGFIDHFVGQDQACSGCHNGTKPWGHYDGECGACHQAAGWFPAGLGDNDHAITGFPLAGGHAQITCEACHPVGRPRGEASPSCVSCHAPDDPHKHLIGDSCDDCHTEVNWFRTRWRHHVTGWPLRGSHRLASCVDCHATGYVGTPTQCWRCHEAEAPRAIPPHQTAQFPLCDQCHRPYTWAVTNYPH